MKAFLLTVVAAWEKNTQQANVLEDFSIARTIASWVNTDVAIACELHNFGTWTSRPELLAKA